MHMIMHGDMELFPGVFHVRDLGCRLRRPNRKERDRVLWGPGVVNFGVLSLYQYTSRLLPLYVGSFIPGRYMYVDGA